MHRPHACPPCLPQVLAYLFAHKLLYPHKLFLLRGNHETRLMNGWEEFYGSRCLLAQCKQRFGEQLGESLWDAANSALDCMPLAAVIDSTVFCVHGGIPRPRQDPTVPQRLPGLCVPTAADLCAQTGKDMRLQDIERIPVPAGLRPHYEHETEEVRGPHCCRHPYNCAYLTATHDCALWPQTIQLAVDMLWADPAAGSEDALGPDGFGEGPRGGGAISYGRKVRARARVRVRTPPCCHARDDAVLARLLTLAQAVEDFLHEFNFSYIMRAHEPTATGIAVSKAARVITVFSTSRDHGMDNASCGCVLVERDCIFPINRLTSSALAKATASPPAAANPAAAAHRVRAAREDADEAAAAKAAAKAAAAKAAAAKDAATEASTQETETATEVEAADADDAPHAEEAEKFSATPARRRSWEAVSSPVDTPPAKRSRTQLSPFVTPMPAGSGSGRQPLSPRPEEAVDSQRRANLEALRAGFKRPRTFVLQPADVAACMPPPVLAAPTTSSATTAGPIATSPTAQAPAPSAFTRRMQTLAQQQQQPKRSFTGASDASCMSSQGAAVGEEHEQPQHKQQQHEQQQHGQQQHEQQSVATQDAEGWQE